MTDGTNEANGANVTNEPPTTPEDLARLAFELYREARSAGDFAPALRALTLAGQLRGLVPESPRRGSSATTKALEAEIKAIETALGVRKV